MKATLRNHFKMDPFFISVEFSVSKRLQPNGFFNELKFDIQADISNTKVEFVDEVDLLNG